MSIVLKYIKHKQNKIIIEFISLFILFCSKKCLFSKMSILVTECWLANELCCSLTVLFDVMNKLLLLVLKQELELNRTLIDFDYEYSIDNDPIHTWSLHVTASWSVWSHVFTLGSQIWKIRLNPDYCVISNMKIYLYTTTCCLLCSSFFCFIQKQNIILQNTNT